MTATNRGTERLRDDMYMTPEWAVKLFLDRHRFAGSMRFLEPGAGSGNIIRMVRAVYPDAEITAVEKRPEEMLNLTSVGADTVIIEDFLEWQKDLSNFTFDVVIGNPPYTYAMEFIHECMRLAQSVAFLLRLDFCGSKKRAQFFIDFPPDIYVLSTRPRFKPGSRTDACEYGWFVWEKYRRLSGHCHGRLFFLGPKP